jgi:hypothetical protein
MFITSSGSITASVTYHLPLKTLRHLQCSQIVCSKNHNMWLSNAYPENFDELKAGCFVGVFAGGELLHAPEPGELHAGEGGSCCHRLKYSNRLREMGG